MFKKVLIANRGEIACRIIKTCRKMGISPVAVYSDADITSLHVELADEAIPIGQAPASQSYLNPQAIIEAALKSGAPAIHPGYGFLSENASFARQVVEAGLTFIGPSPEVIEMMGDKLRAREIAQEIGVPIIPGSKKPVVSVAELKSIGERFGYPLLLKAAAGGGGKGMRVIYSHDAAEELLQLSQNEAQKSFGDNRIYVEKYLESPRHIEIQVLGDHHGNLLHLGERDCSLQRRHQKVMEETPSPFMTPELRQKMVESALQIACHVGYTSAGTLEFMVDQHRNFYFLEMNTRLQVEHPITELLTGLDLVEQMMIIAAGESLTFSQDQITFKGHAIEARVYAEDPSDHFLPSSGRITQYEPPTDFSGIRIDSGIQAGSEASVYYDPLLVKICSWAENRQDALKNLTKALSQFVIDGPTQNLAYLERICRQKPIQDGLYSTHFLEKEMDENLTAEEELWMKATGLLLYVHKQKLTHTDWIVSMGNSGTLFTLQDGKVFFESHEVPIELKKMVSHRKFKAYINGEDIYGRILFNDYKLTIELFGQETHTEIYRPKDWELKSHVLHPEPKPENTEIKAPLPGIIVSLPLEIGQHVKAGQALCVIEAMKMENIIKAPQDGVVQDLISRQGETVTKDQIIVRLKD